MYTGNALDIEEFITIGYITMFGMVGAIEVRNHYDFK